jgi:hypothetical protein
MLHGVLPENSALFDCVRSRLLHFILYSDSGLVGWATSTSPPPYRGENPGGDAHVPAATFRA